jgi:predicted cation transporter
MDTSRIVGSLIALALFAVAGLLYQAARQEARLSVPFGIAVFAAFAVLFLTWFRR